MLWISFKIADVEKKKNSYVLSLGLSSYIRLSEESTSQRVIVTRNARRARASCGSICPENHWISSIIEVVQVAQVSSRPHRIIRIISRPVVTVSSVTFFFIYSIAMSPVINTHLFLRDIWCYEIRRSIY